MAKKGKANRGTKRSNKKAQEYVLLQIPNPYVPKSSGTIHKVGTESEVKKALGALAIASETKIAMLKVVSLKTYRPSVKAGSDALFVEPKKSATSAK